MGVGVVGNWAIISRVVSASGLDFSWLYNENPCAWLLWHWSSRGQLHFAIHEAVRPSGFLVQLTEWRSVSKSHSKWGFVFIPHLKSKYNQLIASKLSRKSAICPRRSPWRPFVWCALSGPHDWTLRDWSIAWPTLTWLAKLVGVSVSSSFRNTNFPHTLKPWNSG